MIFRYLHKKKFKSLFDKYIPNEELEKLYEKPKSEIDALRQIIKQKVQVMRLMLTTISPTLFPLNGDEIENIDKLKRTIERELNKNKNL